ncbi:MAG: helix-turn-helix transcriptional regulator [Candidatus Cryptobacteroides sp.]
MADELTYGPIGNDDFFSEVEKILAEGKVVRLNAKGRSMEPFILDGRDDVILASGIEPKKGSIVLARTGEGIVLHRIINIEGNAVTLMGDGNLYKTESCLKEDILALATRIIHRGKEIDPECFMEMFKAKLWMMARPVRRPLLKIWKIFCK